MPARQLWAFLTENDLRALIGDPASLERRESLPGERRIYLLHRKYSADIVTHLQPAGPFAGWSQIDEEKTDCVVVRLKDSPAGELEPARIYAHVTWWRAADKARKRPMFSIWASQTLKWIAARLPATSAKMIRVGPEALAEAKEGRLRLRYLYRTISP